MTPKCLFPGCTQPRWHWLPRAIANPDMIRTREERRQVLREQAARLRATPDWRP